jgi:hypothetical protein
MTKLCEFRTRIPFGEDKNEGRRSAIMKAIFVPGRSRATRAHGPGRQKLAVRIELSLDATAARAFLYALGATVELDKDATARTVFGCEGGVRSQSPVASAATLGEVKLHLMTAVPGER